MNKENQVKSQLKNAQGRILLQKAKLEYSKAIIDELNKKPEVLDDVLEQLDIEEESLWNTLSGIQDSNIVFYDQALEVAKQAKKK